MFQTSTNRQPLSVRATTPPMSHPTLQALATFAGTGIGPISGSPEIIDSSQICRGPTRWMRKWPSISLPERDRAGFGEPVVQLVEELLAGGQVACGLAHQLPDRFVVLGVSLLDQPPGELLDDRPGGLHRLVTGDHLAGHEIAEELREPGSDVLGPEGAAIGALGPGDRVVVPSRSGRASSAPGTTGRGR